MRPQPAALPEFSDVEKSGWLTNTRGRMLLNARAFNHLALTSSGGAQAGHSIATNAAPWGGRPIRARDGVREWGYPARIFATDRESC